MKALGGSIWLSGFLNLIADSILIFNFIVSVNASGSASSGIGGKL